MINLKAYDNDSFEYHKTVVSKKQKKKNDVDYKKRLEDLYPTIEILFKNYSEHIKNDDLKLILPSKIEGRDKEDLLSLYNYKSKVLHQLKEFLTTTQSGRKFNTCQMCTIEPVGSLDHILPKEEFPEFVVNPLNLFPSCLNCNAKKGAHWLGRNERLFLNLYFDNLPNHQYLKIEFDSYPIPNFSIDKNGLSDEFYIVLNSHCLRLNLFSRFRENSSEVIDPIVTDAKNFIPKMGIDEYRKTIARSTLEMQSIYGTNHWKSLLKLALVNNKNFESLLI